MIHIVVVFGRRENQNERTDGKTWQEVASARLPLHPTKMRYYQIAMEPPPRCDSVITEREHDSPSSPTLTFPGLLTLQIPIVRTRNPRAIAHRRLANTLAIRKLDLIVQRAIGRRGIRAVRQHFSAVNSFVLGNGGRTACNGVTVAFPFEFPSCQLMQIYLCLPSSKGVKKRRHTRHHRTWSGPNHKRCDRNYILPLASSRRYKRCCARRGPSAGTSWTGPWGNGHGIDCSQSRRGSLRGGCRCKLCLG